MTSTSFNIGFGEEKKNSSRVLKPPGGGHSDIFGINDNAEMMTPSKKHFAPPTTIKSCFVHDEPDNNTKKQNNGHNGNGVVYITPDENIQPDIVLEAEKKKIASPEQPRRVKVPPGGFSTPLW